MHALRHILLLACLWGLSALAALSQESDKDFLTRTIQDALSDAGRAVNIDGFRGALSSSASFDRMTIADEEGVWLTLSEVTLVWTRSALLRGRLEVDQLSAKRLDIPRLPKPVAGAALPEAEAQPFSLPDLPVSVNIADFAVEQINLGAPLLGDPVQLSIKAKAQLNDDLGDVDFVAKRTDGTAGRFDIKASLTRTDNVLDLLLNLTEAEKGIAARLLNLPGQPSVEMQVKGSGPMDAFASDVRIATQGQERLAGQITIGAQTPRRASATPDRRIQADIGGDITALLAPRYRDFFGTQVALKIDTLLESNGAVEVSAFDLSARAAALKGKVSINQEGWPSFIDITGRIANPDGSSILLPVGGEGTSVADMILRVAYDAADGEAFDAGFDITALSMSGIEIARTTLGFDGILQGNLGSVGQFLGDVNFAAEGVTLSDQASAEAFGDKITGRATVNYIEGQPIRIQDLDLTGTDYGLAGKIIINGLEQGGLTRLDARLQAQDLSRFSALVGREMDGATALALKGTVTPLSGAFDLKAAGTTQDLRLGIAQADAVLAGRTEVSLHARRDETGTFLRDVMLRNPALTFDGTAALRSQQSTVKGDIALKDLALVVPQYDGPVRLALEANQDAKGWQVNVTTDGPYSAVLSAKGLATGPNAALQFSADVPDVTPFAAPFALPLNKDLHGPLTATGTLRRVQNGWVLDTTGSGPFEVNAGLSGALTPALDLRFDLSMPSVTPLVADLEGPFAAKGRLRQSETGFVIDTTARGPYASTATINGALTPRVDISFDVGVPNLRPLVAQLNGPGRATGQLRQTGQGFVIDTSASGPYSLRATVRGLATGPQMQLEFEAGLPNVQPLVPGMSGPLDARGQIRQTSAGIAVETRAKGPYASTATLSGVITGPEASVEYSLAMPNIGVLVERVNGPLTTRGTARKEGSAWRIDTKAEGPSGTRADVGGLINGDGSLALSITGSAPLGLSRPFIAPRNLQGQARFDLALNGPPTLSALSGTIETSGASLSAPNLRVALTDIAGNVRLGSNRAALDIAANASNGGRVKLGGGITLTPALPAEISVALQDVVLIDPRLFRTALSGALRVAGPLTGGARVEGQINVGETNVNVPATGLTSIGDIPQITHLGSTAATQRTRQKAGVTAQSGHSPTASTTGPAYGLNLQVNAPNRIFVRGRGLDAELGGGLTLSGSTNRVISAGRFELIRGRLDILGKRFTLEEGTIQFEGDLVPYLRFVSTTPTTGGEVRVIVEGPADAPEVTFASTPEAPQDEVLSQLLFGRNISEISAFQALQLASAVATLAGRGGGGIISNLREGFGLDDLDVTTTEDGATALRLGKYLTDNVYTDVTASSDGQAEVSLNLDITPNLKGKATLGSDGDSSIGLFFEKDY